MLRILSIHGSVCPLCRQWDRWVREGRWGDGRRWPLCDGILEPAGHAKHIRNLHAVAGSSDATGILSA